MKKLLGGAILLFCMYNLANATVTWDTPAGVFNLDLTTTETLIGYDAVLKQAIAGASLPVYTDPKGIVTLQVGAVAPWPNENEATVQPYISAGHNILKEIPGLQEYQNVAANVFARYVPEQGKAGVGISLSYQFAVPASGGN